MPPSVRTERDTMSHSPLRRTYSVRSHPYSDQAGGTT